MASEQYGFTFSVIFIIIFAAVLGSIPAGLNGEGSTPESVGNISPSLLGDYSDHANWTTSSYVGTPIGLHDYDLNSLHWSAIHTVTGYFYIGAKDYIGGVLWLGGYWYCDFQSPSGINRGTALTLANIDADAEDGSVTYTMLYHANGKSAGGFVIAWNTTTYTTAAFAWGNSSLYFLHGIGFAEKATNNIGALVVGLLTLSIPNVPVMIGLLMAVPIWACIFYVLWYIIKEMIPFV